MIRIDLPDGVHVLGSDDKQFILYRRDEIRELTTGEESLTPISYWSSLRWLLRGLVEKKLLLSEATTVEEFRADIDRLFAYIDLATGYVPPAPADKRKRGAATSATSEKEEKADGPAEETALMSIM